MPGAPFLHAGRSELPLPDPHASSRRPLRPADFPDWTSYYWTYQYELASTQLLPCLQSWGVWRQGVRILDVGCGDAGATCALAEHGARIDGFDLEPRRLAMASERARARGTELRLTVADITDPATLTDLDGPYDLILFRDVLEHIPDVDAALAQSRERLAPDGGIVVIYPPYWSVYGGHQQILDARARLGVRWAKLPFVHWLGAGVWGGMARGGAVSADLWQEVETVRQAGLTLSGLSERASRHSLRVSQARRFLLRPSFYLRYGLPVFGAGLLGRVPGMREVLVTGSWELLTRND